MKKAGYIVTCFLIGRWISSILWGILIDKYGRKRALIVSLLSVSGLTLLFGYTTTYLNALLIKFLIGVSNGFLTIGKTLTTEICPDNYKAWSIGITNTAFVLGLSYGGYISYSITKSNQSVVLTSSSIIACFGMIIALLCGTFLQETLNDPNVDTDFPIVNQEFQRLEESPDIETQGSFQGERTFDEMNNLQQLKFILSIPNATKLTILFFCNALLGILTGSLLPSWIQYSLGLSYLKVAQAAFSKLQVLVQLTAYIYFQRSRGDFWLLRVCHLIQVPLFLSLPCVKWFVDGSNSEIVVYFLATWLLIRNIATFLIFSALLRFTNDLVRSNKR